VHTGSSTVRLAVPLQFPGKYWQQTLPMNFRAARAMKLPGDMNRTVKRVFLVSFWPSLAHFGSPKRGLSASTSALPTARAVSEPRKVPFFSSFRFSCCYCEPSKPVFFRIKSAQIVSNRLISLGRAIAAAASRWREGERSGGPPCRERGFAFCSRCGKTARRYL
jgi:hypothetical protein